MFNGIFAGWNILCKMFKKDNMFCKEVPSTDLQAEPELDCSEQGKHFFSKLILRNHFKVHVVLQLDTKIDLIFWVKFTGNSI